MSCMATTVALAHCTDVASLRSELHALCSAFGPVSRMNILPAPEGGKRQVVCFIRLASPEQERRMVSQLGVERFGNELFMVLDLAN
jgi:RNA recognition motif